MQNVVKINNFKLGLFINLLKQNLMVNNQLILQFSPKMVKTVAYSTGETMVKLITIPLESLINKPESLDDTNLFGEIEPVKEKLVFPEFNFYSLRGDLFVNYLSVNNAEIADIEMSINKNESDGTLFASSIKVITRKDDGSLFKIDLILSTEQLLTQKVNDYSALIKAATPTNTMFNLLLSSIQLQEVKSYIKKLEKANDTNTQFLTITIDKNQNQLIINDNVFQQSYDLIIPEETKTNFIETITFNILKSDFIILGNHSYQIFVDYENKQIIFITKFNGSLIVGLTSKYNPLTLSIDNQLDNGGNELFLSEISEYL